MLSFSGVSAALAFGASLTNYHSLPLHSLKIFSFVHPGLSIRFGNPIYVLIVRFVMSGVASAPVGRSAISVR